MEPTPEQDFYRTPDDRLCQGDILRSVPQIHLKRLPLQFIRPFTSTRGIAYTAHAVVGWEGGDPEANRQQPQTRFNPSGDDLVSFGQIAQGIVLSHDCEIDKEENHRQVALIRPMSSLQEEHRIM